MSEECYRAVSSVLGALTVVGLFLYVWKTWQIARAAVEQAEGGQKPCLTLLQIPDHSDDALLEGMIAEVASGPGKLTAKVVNIGSGPAINAHFRFYNSKVLGDPMQDAPLLPPTAAGHTVGYAVSNHGYGRGRVLHRRVPEP